MVNDAGCTLSAERRKAKCDPAFMRLIDIRTTQCGCRTFIPVKGSLWDDLSDPVFDGVRASLKSRDNSFPLAKSARILFGIYRFAFSSFFAWVGSVGLGSSYWKGVCHLS